MYKYLLFYFIFLICYIIFFLNKPKILVNKLADYKLTIKSTDDLLLANSIHYHNNVLFNSIYNNYFYTNKKDSENKFGVTVLANKTNKMSCIYIPGYNDYFYNYKFGKDLFDKGYNFYAISFPNFGFVTDTMNNNYSTFDSIPKLYQYIDMILEQFNITNIDVMIGYSTGALIATCYADYKKTTESNVKKLLLFSPLFDFPNNKFFIHNIISYIGIFFPKFNINLLRGKIDDNQLNNTTTVEFNEIKFNPTYKSLFDTFIYAEWVYACSIQMKRIHNNMINVDCDVIMLCSDKSDIDQYTTIADNTLDIKDMIHNINKITSKNVKIHIIKDSIHNTTLRINNINDYL